MKPNRKTRKLYLEFKNPQTVLVQVDDQAVLAGSPLLFRYDDTTEGKVQFMTTLQEMIKDTLLGIQLRQPQSESLGGPAIASVEFGVQGFTITGNQDIVGLLLNDIKSALIRFWPADHISFESNVFAAV